MRWGVGVPENEGVAIWICLIDNFGERSFCGLLNRLQDMLSVEEMKHTSG